MPERIANQPTPSQVSGRLATWHRVMEEAGLEYADLQKPIDDPDFRVRLVKYWRSEGTKTETSPIPPASAQALMFPAVGEEFDIEIDGEQPPMLIVTKTGFNPENWQFLGPSISGKHVYRAKLVDLGSINDRNEAIKLALELEPTWVLAPGQARDSFEKMFPRHDGRPVAFGYNEWHGPSRRPQVACLVVSGGNEGRVRSGGYESADLDTRSGPTWDRSFSYSNENFRDSYLWMLIKLQPKPS